MFSLRFAFLHPVRSLAYGTFYCSMLHFGFSENLVLYKRSQSQDYNCCQTIIACIFFSFLFFSRHLKKINVQKVSENWTCPDFGHPASVPLSNSLDFGHFLQAQTVSQINFYIKQSRLFFVCNQDASLSRFQTSTVFQLTIIIQLRNTD